MSLESNKTLGGVGAILVVIGFLGFFGTGYAGLLTLVGIILTLVALKGLSDYYNEGGIFNNALYGFIIAIIGVVVFIAAILMTALAVLSELGINIRNWTDLMTVQHNWQRLLDLSNLWTFIGAIILSFVALFVFVIIASIFFRKSLSVLSAKSGERIFETAGLLWLIGAVLTIILVGFILIWVAWILIAVGFFSIKTPTTQPPPPPSPS